MREAPNAAQVEYWNTARHWVEDADGHDDMLRPLGDMAIDALEVRSGMRVLDVGCGTGATTRELAAAVGPQGEAVGVDVSALLLDVARERSGGTGNVLFVEADAQTHAFERESFDRAYSRFGVMFFADPVAAFANIRAALRTEGRIAFVCWQAAERNEWVRVPTDAVRGHVDVSFEAADGPNPFAFGEAGYLRSILDRAGFTNIDIANRVVPVLLGGHGDLETGVSYVMSSRVGRRLLEGTEASEASERVALIREALDRHLTAEGVRIDAAVWLVTASPEA